MKRRNVRSMNKHVLMILCGIFSAGLFSAQAEKPNIVLIYIDDWAWNGSPVAMNPDMPNSLMPVVQMPNLEKLASQGMKFSNAYGSPQCSPGRACVLSGQTSARSGFTVYMNPKGQDYYDESRDYEGFEVIPCIANETMDPATTFAIPEALAPMGYVSAHLGKWHLRGDPGEHGYVLHDGDTDNNPGNTIKANLKPGEEKPRRLTEELMTDPKLMFSITEKAIGFMEEQVQADKPFYVQISHYAMHAGSECKVATREKYVNDPWVQAWYKANEKTADNVNVKEDPAVWLGMADDLDGRIGAVLDKIDELGIADSTYVVMVADNGYRHEFYPGLTQPLHARKWWVWEGGIRVPMIVRGPGIEPGSLFTGNVVNYDLLPTFVEWAGGDPEELKEIDGVSLASYLEGENPDSEFLNRNLHFHYPHYRSTMPHSAMISGNQKVLHFWGHDDIPMLFDLSGDIGEVRNIAEEYPDEHRKLFDQMMSYLEEVGGRIPRINPDYDPEKFEADKDYWYRVNWGPFSGERPLDDDERAPLFQLDEEDPPNGKGENPRVRFTNLEEGAQLPAGSELHVKVEVSDADDIASVKLYLNGLLINAQGMTSAPQVWSGSGDPLLKSLVPGRYHLEVVAENRAGRTGRQEIRIAAGEVSGNDEGTPEDEVYRVILNEGERIMGDEAIRFPRLEALLKLEDDGKLMLRDENSGKLFEVDDSDSDGPHYATLEDGQFRIYRGTPRDSKAVVWESPKPEGKGTYQLGITTGKKLVVFEEVDDSERKVVWKSH